MHIGYKGKLKNKNFLAPWLRAFLCDLQCFSQSVSAAAPLGMTFLLDECLLHSLLDIAYWCIDSPKLTSLQEVLSFSCCFFFKAILSSYLSLLPLPHYLFIEYLFKNNKIIFWSIIVPFCYLLETIKNKVISLVTLKHHETYTPHFS